MIHLWMPLGAWHTALYTGPKSIVVEWMKRSHFEWVDSAWMHRLVLFTTMWFERTICTALYILQALPHIYWHSKTSVNKLILQLRKLTFREIMGFNPDFLIPCFQRSRNQTPSIPKACTHTNTIICQNSFKRPVFLMLLNLPSSLLSKLYL